MQKVKVKVSNSTGFLRLFGYFKADGTTFVETNKITVDPTKDPTGTDNISAGLPRIIVIMRRDGELQVLSRDYDKDKPGTVNINGTNYTVDASSTGLTKIQSKKVQRLKNCSGIRSVTALVSRRA